MAGTLNSRIYFNHRCVAYTKMKSFKWILLATIVGLTYYLVTKPTTMTLSSDIEMKFDEFKKKEKFIEEDFSFYPGAQTPEIRVQMNERINMAADDFIQVAKRNQPTDKEFQEAIGTGLGRFHEIYLDLDTEDRERICTYFEEMMDIVGLESSGGHLNEFMYGFDPTSSSKSH